MCRLVSRKGNDFKSFRKLNESLLAELKVRSAVLDGEIDCLNDEGKLDHVGFTSSIHSDQRKTLTEMFEKMIKPPGFTGKAPGGLSRWSTKRSMEWEPLDPRLVVEVQFDHLTGGRFRHGTKLLRWRPEKSPRQCTMAQVEQEARSPLRLIG